MADEIAHLRDLDRKGVRTDGKGCSVNSRIPTFHDIAFRHAGLQDASRWLGDLDPATADSRSSRDRGGTHRATRVTGTADRRGC